MSNLRAVLQDANAAAAVQRGETYAYRALVERYHAPLMRYARRFLGNAEAAEDAVQDAFLRAYENIRQYDPRRPFSTWIYRITHNVCVDILRRRMHEPIPFFDADTLFPHPIARESTEDNVVRTEMLDLVARYLATLDPKYREVVVLHTIAERSYEEIADIMHIPVSTVGVRLKRARDRLRAQRAQERNV